MPPAGEEYGGLQRPVVIIGNWKMNLTQQQVQDFLQALNQSALPDDVCVGIAPPAMHLLNVKAQVPSGVWVGPQNCWSESFGAMTGELGIGHVVDGAFDFVILGHSERRQFLSESSALVAAKAKALRQASIKPLVCVGESLEERQAGRHHEVVLNQLRDSLNGLTSDDVSASLIAYEPVWAIGTGETATAEQAQEMQALIRSCVAETWSLPVADQLPILYGGSVKPSNAKELLACPDVDGALVGGASLKSEDFMSLIEQARPSKDSAAP